MSRSELKESAKKSLKGKYGDIIIMIIVVGLIAAVGACLGQFIDNSLGLVKKEIIDFGITKIEMTTRTGLFTSLISFVITGVVGFGTINYFLNISRGKDVNWKDVFAKKDMFVAFVILSLLAGLIICVGTILLIIPGIIAGLALSMIYYIKLDNPDMGYVDCLKKSNELMKGHKWEYFVLNLSFIGWALLVPLTLGLLSFWLAPYMAVTECNFYNKLIKK